MSGKINTEKVTSACKSLGFDQTKIDVIIDNWDMNIDGSVGCVSDFFNLIINDDPEVKKELMHDLVVCINAQLV